MRQLPAADYHGLKAATRQLLKTGGGGNEGAKITRVGQQVLSTYGSLSPDHVERFAPIDVIADLEAECGEPIVTRKMAELNNCLLVPLPHGLKGDGVAASAGRSAHEFGELMEDVFRALKDGRISRDEAPSILGNIRELMLELASMAEAVKLSVQRDEEAGE